MESSLMAIPHQVAYQNIVKLEFQKSHKASWINRQNPMETPGYSFYT